MEIDGLIELHLPYSFSLFVCFPVQGLGNCLTVSQTVFLLSGLPFAPESPWHLVRKGKMEAATKSYARLYPNETDVAGRVASIKQLVDIEIQEDKGSWLDCFRGTDLLRTGISTGVFACQHLVGIIFVLGFSGYFFQLAGLSVSKSFDLGVGVTACGVLGNFLSWFVVNNYGRRKVFVQGMAVLVSPASQEESPVSPCLKSIPLECHISLQTFNFPPGNNTEETTNSGSLGNRLRFSSSLASWM